MLKQCNFHIIKPSRHGFTTGLGLGNRSCASTIQESIMHFNKSSTSFVWLINLNCIYDLEHAATANTGVAVCTCRSASSRPVGPAKLISMSFVEITGKFLKPNGHVLNIIQPSTLLNILSKFLGTLKKRSNIDLYFYIRSYNFYILQGT